MHDKMLDQTPIIVTMYCVTCSGTIRFIRLVESRVQRYKDIMKSELLKYVYLIMTNIDLPSIKKIVYIRHQL